MTQEQHTGTTAQTTGSPDLQADIEQALIALWERESAYRDAVIADAEAEYAYKIAQAAAYLKAEGTEKARSAEALVAVAAEYKTHLECEAVKVFTREALMDAQAALSARQSLLSYDAKANLTFGRNSA